MSAYSKLPSGSQSNINFFQIQENLKQFQIKIKEFPRLPESSKKSARAQIDLICQTIEIEFSKPRKTAEDKSRLEVLEKNYVELKKNFGSASSNVYDERRESDEFFRDIEERDSLALTQEQLENEAYLKQNKEIEQLHKDLVTVNEMFKDTAMMVKEQGEMLVETDKEVTKAAGNSGKAVVELHKAEGYQRSARKKICIIMIIAMVVVGVLLAIVFGVVSKP